MMEKIGPITILTGETNSRVPFSTSLLIEGRSEATLIDCGGGQTVFDYIKRHAVVSDIYLTHYHLDHVWGAYLFPESDIHINPYDYKKLVDPYELAKVNGVTTLYNEDKVQQWVDKYFIQGQPFREGLPYFKPVMGLVDHTYSYNKPIHISGTSMIMLHTPGHTEGYCCPYFPEHGVLFVGDFDLTSFGPWYMNADSDIEDFITSSKLTLETDAEYFITAHQKGSYNRRDYEQHLADYIGIIYKREEKILQAIEKGLAPKEMVNQEIFYFLQNHKQNPQLMESEIIGIAKHLKWLLKKGYTVEDYNKAFVNYYHINEKALDYRSEPVYTR